MSTVPPMTQRTAKALIAQFTGQANILTIPRVFVSMTGSLEAALFLSQCLYWSERTDDPDGWFWKRAEHWQAELSLSEYQVRKARKILAPFGLETDLRTVNNTPTLFYRIDGDQLYKCILQFLQNASRENSEMHSAESAGSTYTETTVKDHEAESEPPAPVTANISLTAPTGASRDMAPIRAGMPVNKRPDAPKVQPRPIKQPLPADFTVSAEQEHWAQATVPTLLRRHESGARLLDLETEKFRAHYEGTGEQQAAWGPMWRKWMLMAVVNYPAAAARPISPAPKAPQYFAKRG